jgi:hypothetical protein
MPRRRRCSSPPVMARADECGLAKTVLLDSQTEPPVDPERTAAARRAKLVSQMSNPPSVVEYPGVVSKKLVTIQNESEKCPAI